MGVMLQIGKLQMGLLKEDKLARIQTS